MTHSKIRRFFAPAPHIQRLPDDQVKQLYPKFRWSILESTFIGYGTFYLVRNNLGIVAKEMEGALGYSKSAIGYILAVTAISYGIGKFLMGSLSDRSNPRKFMPFGLLITAACNFIFGSVESYYVHLALWSLNGLAQGMGWPPCGRSLGHWFSVKERGLIFGVWNMSPNLGGGLIGIIAAWAVMRFGGWQYAFYVPGVIAVCTAIYLFCRLRDTPQSVGLPSIEEYKHAYTEDELAHHLDTHEKELGTRELFVDYIFKNKLLWLIAIANIFVYIARYSMIDWGPTYLRDVKGATLTGGGIAVLVLEFGGIPSILLMGWLSDKVAGRRGMVSLLCMIPVLAAFAVIRINPPGRLWLDMTMLAVVGFFVYPPVMLLAVTSLDLTSKKAVGTAAGFVGLFGYIGRTAQAIIFGWMQDYFGRLYGVEAAWNIIFYSILGCTMIAIILLGFTWKIKPKA